MIIKKKMRKEKKKNIDENITSDPIDQQVPPQSGYTLSCLCKNIEIFNDNQMINESYMYFGTFYSKLSSSSYIQLITLNNIEIDDKKMQFISI